MSFFLAILALVPIFLAPRDARAFTFAYGHSGATDSYHQEAIAKLVAAFKAAHPDAEIQAITGQSYVTSVSDTVVKRRFGGTPPDVAIVGLVESPVLHGLGLLRRLDELLETAELKRLRRGLRPELKAQHYGRGRDVSHHILPFNRSHPVVYVNLELVPEAEKKSSLSLDALLDLLRKNRSRLKGDAAAAATLTMPLEDWVAEQLLVSSRGGPTLSGRAARLDDPASRSLGEQLRAGQATESLRFVKSQHKGYADFVAGRTAMVLTSLSAFAAVRANAKFPVAVLPPPRLKHATLVFGGGDLVLPRATDKPLSAETRGHIAKFLKWFYLEGGNVRWASLTGYLPLVRNARSEPALKREGWRFESFYALDDFCNIIELRKVMTRVFAELVGAAQLDAVLKAGASHLGELLARPCPRLEP